MGIITFDNTEIRDDLKNAIDTTFDLTNSIFRKSNIFDKDNVIANYYVSYQNGVVGPLANASVTEFVPVNEDCDYIIYNAYRSKIQQGAFYDINKQYISGFTGADVRTYIAHSPQNAAFARFTVWTKDLPSYAIYEGSSYQRYEQNSYERVLNSSCIDFDPITAKSLSSIPRAKYRTGNTLPIPDGCFGVYLYGAVTQNGTPTPTTRVPIVPDGVLQDGKYVYQFTVTYVNNSTEAISIALDKPLYPDDYIDVINGVVYRNDVIVTLDGLSIIDRAAYSNNRARFILAKFGYSPSEQARGWSDAYTFSGSPLNTMQDNTVTAYPGSDQIYFCDYRYDNVNDLVSYLSNNPITLILKDYKETKESISNYAKISKQIKSITSGHNLMVRYITDSDSVTVGASGDYQSILAALKETEDSVVIHVLSGVYDIQQEYIDYYGNQNFWEDYAGYAGEIGQNDPFMRGLWLGNGRNIYFDANAIVQFHYTGSNHDTLHAFSPIAPGGNCEIHGLHLEFSGCRYAVHDDFNAFDGTTIYDHCIFDGQSENGDTIGGGVGRSNTYIFDTCLFLNNHASAPNGDISYHNNLWPNNSRSMIIVKNCYGENTCKFKWYGTNTEITECIAVGCQFKAIQCLPHQIEPNATENMHMTKWNCIETS